MKVSWVGGAFALALLAGALPLHSSQAEQAVNSFQTVAVDLGFDPGYVSLEVMAVAVHPPGDPHAGKIIIGGDLTHAGDVTRSGLARLNPDGSIDASFAPALLASGRTNPVVRSIYIYPPDHPTVADRGKILIGGDFWIENPEDR